MPLLRKQTFVRKKPEPDMKPDEEVFYCEATKEVFRDYEEFFERTILCNSLVWSCSITGKTNLTFEEALECEKQARKRLGNIPKPLKRGLLWLADHAQRGRISDLVDDVYVFASGRYFKNEIVEAIINDQWCDCRVVEVLPPSQDEIDKDAQQERERQLKDEAESSTSPSKTKKPKKSFFPPEHLFKYELEEVEDEEEDDDDDDKAKEGDEKVPETHVIDAEDIRREKGTYTREKNLLFLKNIMELGKDGNFCVKPDIAEKHKVSSLTFTELFSGPMPVFEITKRVKSILPSFTSKNKKDASSSKRKNGKKVGKGQGTLDSWMKGDGSSKGGSSGVKKQTAAEMDAEMKRIREQNERFKEEMRQRAEEAKKRKLEERAREKERKKEEARLLKEVLNEWKKPRDDLECEDLKALPKPSAVRCRIPNKLFGDFLALLEFFDCFKDVLEVKDSFGASGVSFDTLEKALTDTESRNETFEILSFMLQALFDLQNEEDDEVKLDKHSVAIINPNDIDKSVLGRDEDVANQIKEATVMARWPMKHQGQSLCELHMNEWSITEILRLHLAASGAFRSDRLVMWLYQQRGGYRLPDDPGLQFRMEHPQILEALNSKTIYELNVDEKIKILNCLMYQILSFATVRDEIDEKFAELQEAKTNLRNHQLEESRRQKQLAEAVKQKRREELIQKKEEELKAQEQPKAASNPSPAVDNFAAEAHLTERQRLAIQSKKEQEEKEKQKKEDLLKSQAEQTERVLAETISDLMGKSGRTFLGRDRAYRRYWITETVPGLYVEHDDEFVGECFEDGTPYDPNARPMDEETAMSKVKEILDAKSSEEKSSSDKENDHNDDKKAVESAAKTYSKKQNSAVLKQKVLSTKNGSLTVEAGSSEIKQEEVEPSSTPALATEEEDVKPAAVLPWGLCSADMESCVVHSTILPRTFWSYYGSLEEVDNLIESLNERGIRESELKEKLVSERDRLAKHLKHVNKTKLESGDVSMGQDTADSISAIADLTLRDQILEMEEKIFCGTLGTLKIRDRIAWQEAIKHGGYDSQCEGLSWGGKSVQDTPFESRLQSAAVSRDPSRPPSPSDPTLLNGCDNDNKRDSSGSSGSISARKHLKKNRELASAILQIGQMVDPKYLKTPLGEDEKEKKKRLKEEEKRRKMLEQDGEEADGDHNTSKDSISINTPLQDWESSLMSSTSAAQLFIHLTTLESSIMWSKSLLNTKCRICRRKNDPEKMLLCDGCDRGHHLFCLKPKLKSIPDGDWYCNDCKPKMRVRSPKKKSRRVFEEDEEEEQSDCEAEVNGKAGSDNSDAEENEEGDEDSQEDEDSPLRRRKKPQRDPPAKKQKKKSPPVEEKRKPPKRGGLSQLLGQRRCATEANERIARVHQQEIHSGNSSGSENSERATGRLRERRTKSSSKLVEEPPSNVSSARSKRRRAVDDELDTMFNPTVLEDLLNQMVRNKDGWPFDRPITKADAPDYHKIVRRPMDLGTIRSNLNRMKYTCNQEVLEDIRLVFDNCWMYNRSDAEEYQCGVRLERYFLKEAKKLNLIGQDEVSSAPNEDITNDEDDEPLAKRARRTL